MYAGIVGVWYTWLAAAFKSFQMCPHWPFSMSLLKTVFQYDEVLGLTEAAVRQSTIPGGASFHPLVHLAPIRVGRRWHHCKM
jgi:hypothetical protein